MIPTDFEVMNWGSAFDSAKHVGVVPPGATVKSIFVRDLLAQTRKRGLQLKVEDRYLSQKDYPLRGYMTMLIEASALLYPSSPPRAGLRYLGRTVFPTFVDSLVGRVMLGVMGSDVISIMKLANKAAAASISIGQAVTLKAEPGEAILHLRNVYFSDTYQVGVFEGMLDSTKKHGASVRVHRNALDDVYLQLTWREPAQGSVAVPGRSGH